MWGSSSAAGGFTELMRRPEIHDSSNANSATGAAFPGPHRYAATHARAPLQSPCVILPLQTGIATGLSFQFSFSALAVTPVATRK